MKKPLSLQTIVALSLISCSLDPLAGNTSKLISKEVSNGSYAERGRCIPPTMSCSLEESTVSNEEYASATIVCSVPRRACITSVTYAARNLGTSSLTRYGRTFVGTIDTQAAVAGTYSIDLTGYDDRTSTSTTLSLNVVDLYAPSLSCNVIDGINDGSQDLVVSCTIEDETAMGTVYYISSLGSDSMTNSEGSPYEVNFDVTGLSSETYTFTIFATDGAGNVDYTEIIGHITDQTSPTFSSIYTDVSSVLNDSTESFTIYACFSDETDGTQLGGTVTATIDSLIETLSYNSGSNCFISSAINGNNFSEGTYTITVTGSDTAGNSISDNNASIEVTNPSSCPYICTSNICLYVDGVEEATLSTTYPTWMSSIDTIRLGHSGQYFDNLTLAVDGVTYVNENFNTDVGCFSNGYISSGIYVTDMTDNECYFPSFDATTTQWMVSIDVIAGSNSPNLSLRNSLYTAAPGSNWSFGGIPGYYLDDGAGTGVGFASGTPDPTVNHTLVMCNTP